MRAPPPNEFESCAKSVMAPVGGPPQTPRDRSGDTRFQELRQHAAEFEETVLICEHIAKHRCTRAQEEALSKPLKALERAVRSFHKAVNEAAHAQTEYA